MNIPEDIKNRLAAATPGPWDWQTHDMAGARWSLEGKGEGILTCAAMLWPEETNAEFIAHAPEDIARLVKALEAALGIPELVDHKHGDLNFIDGWGAAVEEVRARITEALDS